MRVPSSSSSARCSCSRSPGRCVAIFLAIATPPGRVAASSTRAGIGDHRQHRPTEPGRSASVFHRRRAFTPLRLPPCVARRGGPAVAARRASDGGGAPSVSGRGAPPHCTHWATLGRNRETVCRRSFYRLQAVQGVSRFSIAGRPLSDCRTALIGLPDGSYRSAAVPNRHSRSAAYARSRCRGVVALGGRPRRNGPMRALSG